jgi:hypothetical protein
VIYVVHRVARRAARAAGEDSGRRCIQPELDHSSKGVGGDAVGAVFVAPRSGAALDVLTYHDSPARTAVVHESERTRVTRVFLPTGTVIRKELLGRDA